MSHILKSTLILPALSLALATPAFSNNAVPASDKLATKPETIKISVESFEKNQAELGLKLSHAKAIQTQPASTLSVEEFPANETSIIEPQYELTGQSIAFIGSTRMNNKGFAAYQRSAMTPEGRVTEPLESLASVGVRSKF